MYPVCEAAKPIAVPGSKQKALQALIQPPVIAWPTIFIWLSVMVLIPVCDWLAIRGTIPLWTACILNSLIMYPLFGVMHDATHRAISKIPAVNDWVGSIALILAAPYVGLGVFRWAHMQHHRFTNGPKDPDNWVHGAWWTLPFRWATYDLYYLSFIIRSEDKIGRKQLGYTSINAALTVMAIVALVHAGYGREVLILWFIPARITLAYFGFVFFWLPHVKNDVSAQQNLTLASGIRLGYERFFNIVCQYQNYHLLHHLWPSTPPYNHPKIWRLMKDDIMRRDLAVQYDFALTPTVVPGKSGASGGDHA